MMVEFPADNPNVHILSLAGGGYMGLFTADVLAEIESDGVSLFETTDLFAGTSVGALIALGLACEKSAGAIAQIMREKGEEIFPALRSFPIGGPLVQALWQRGESAPYDPAPLRESIEKLVGTTKMGDLKRRTIVPAVDLTAGSFRVFRGGVDGVDADKSVADVALASAAAPTYYPVHPIGNELFADGGLVANAPDAIAVLEAMNELGASPTATRLLAVGTTLKASGLAGTNEKQDWGVKDWAPHLMDFLMAGQIALARDVARALIGTDSILTIDPVRTTNQDAVVGLDKATSDAKAALSALAAAEVKRLRETEAKARFLKLWQGHRAQPTAGPGRPMSGPRIRPL